MKNKRKIIMCPINPYKIQEANYEVECFLRQNNFELQNINNEYIFVKNADVTMIFAGAIKLDFQRGNYVVQGWMYGSDFFGFKRRYDKEVGLEGFVGMVFKVEHKKILQEIANIIRKYNC